MMNLVFAFVLLVLACAIVLLFAMFGELAARVPDFSRSIDRGPLRPVEGARIGHSPASWPPNLSRLATAEQGLLLVLSNVCASCEDIGRQLDADPLTARHFAIAVSCGSRQTGEAFVARHRLEPLDHFIDVGGEWVRGEFEIMVSPTGLVFRNGRLQSAFVFRDVKTLRRAAVDTSPIPNSFGGVIA